MSLDPNPFGKITEFANHYDLDNPPWMAKWGVSGMHRNQIVTFADVTSGQNA
jgi:hypothetical protein